MEPRFARLLPEVTIPIGPDRFAALAARALAPKQADVISLAHLHTPAVSVRDQAVVIIDRLRRARALTFRALTGDSPNLVTTVARFLALLELFREGAVAFEQLTAAGRADHPLDRAARPASWTSPTSSTIPGRRRPPQEEPR